MIIKFGGVLVCNRYGIWSIPGYSREVAVRIKHMFARSHPQVWKWFQQCVKDAEKERKKVAKMNAKEREMYTWALAYKRRNEYFTAVDRGRREAAFGQKQADRNDYIAERKQELEHAGLDGTDPSLGYREVRPGVFDRPS